MTDRRVRVNARRRLGCIPTLPLYTFSSLKKIQQVEMYQLQVQTDADESETELTVVDWTESVLRSIASGCRDRSLMTVEYLNSGASAKRWRRHTRIESSGNRTAMRPVVHGFRQS